MIRSSAAWSKAKTPLIRASLDWAYLTGERNKSHRLRTRRRAGTACQYGRDEEEDSTMASLNGYVNTRTAIPASRGASSSPRRRISGPSGAGVASTSRFAGTNTHDQRETAMGATEQRASSGRTPASARSPPSLGGRPSELRTARLGSRDSGCDRLDEAAAAQIY